MRRCQSLLKAVLLSLFLMPAFNQAEANTVVTGLEVKKAILNRLSQEEIFAIPKVSENRLYYACETKLMVSPKYEGNWDTVTVACPNSNKVLEWSVMIRLVGATPEMEINLSPTPNNSPKVVVLLASVKKGEVLTSDIIALAPPSRGSQLGSFYRIEDVAGRRATQSLSAMQPLRARHLEYDWALTSGQPVLIVKRISGLEISTIGESLDNAQINDIINVKNIKSGKVISVRVDSSKKVTPIANIN